MSPSLAPATAIDWLIAHGRRLLESSGDAKSADWGRSLAPWQSELLRQQIGFRRRSRSRFPAPDLWLWTDVSLAQASDHWSAHYKASLFPIGERVLDACCGAGSDLVALAKRGEVLGIDADAALAALAQDNARAHGLDVRVQAARLTGQFPSQLSRGWSARTTWLSIDPDRRPDGQRTTDAQAFSPALDQVLQMAQQCMGGIIKLAPSTRTDERLTADIDANCNRMWLGNQGECRQLLLLTGELRRISPPHGNLHSLVSPRGSTDSGPAHTAVLCEPPTGGQLTAATTYCYQATLPERVAPCPPTAEVGAYVFELSPTLHAAELHRPWSTQHGLSPICEAHGYYTSNTLVCSPWSQAFECITVLAWDDRKIRKWLRGFGAGQVEVKVRGVYPLQLHIDANACQRRYSRAGGTPVTLLVTRIGDRLRGIAARRLPSTQRVSQQL